VHAYAHVAADYALLKQGASIGEKYGPIVVAREPMTIPELSKKKIAVPGELTTAFLTLSIALDTFEYEVIAFDQIFDAVRTGAVDAGLIIHEGQLTYPKFGFHNVLDLGQWWYDRHSLPLPLGVNGVRKDLGIQVCRQISDCMKRSIEYGLQHREEAMEYAMKYARNTEQSTTDQFVGMYVNHFTQDIGERGMEAIRRLLGEGYAKGIVPAAMVEFI
jgi:1,4-dihydroxy-6-naphthoate synthase